MTARGRTALAELIAPKGDIIESVQRPDAPYELTDKQAEVWRFVVQDLPADWFSPKNYDLLKMYCRHIVESDRISAMIENMVSGTDIDVGDYKKLCSILDMQSRSIAHLATKMRLTQHSLVDKKIKLQNYKAKNPWDVEDAN